MQCCSSDWYDTLTEHWPTALKETTLPVSQSAFGLDVFLWRRAEWPPEEKPREASRAAVSGAPAGEAPTEWGPSHVRPGHLGGGSESHTGAYWSLPVSRDVKEGMGHGGRQGDTVLGDFTKLVSSPFIVKCVTDCDLWPTRVCIQEDIFWLIEVAINFNN